MQDREGTGEEDRDSGRVHISKFSNAGDQPRSHRADLSENRLKPLLGDWLEIPYPSGGVSSGQLPMGEIRAVGCGGRDSEGRGARSKEEKGAADRCPVTISLERSWLGTAPSPRSPRGPRRGWGGAPSRAA